VAAGPLIVKVDLPGAPYEIVIQPGLLEQFALPEGFEIRNPRVVVITDDHVGQLWLAKLKRRLKKSFAQVDSIVVPHGERAKSVEVANSIWQRLLAFGTDRHTLIMALGGGVVGDLAGFVAATYMRGLDLVQVPTTLLSQVDSSVGGKVGVNLPQGKNLVGAFWQPKGVLIDPSVLSTLSDREYRAGLAEVVKYGAILDEKFFTQLEKNVIGLVSRNIEVLQHVVARCCEIKASVVIADERETSGRRALLNFGHTFGHALEQVTGYTKVLHGEAVAMGMSCATKLAVALQLVDDEMRARLEDLLVILGLPTKFPKVPADQILAAMQNDKKKGAAGVQLVLPTKLGSGKLVPWPGDDAVKRVL
jgi:3-dehydroquinate synthase